MRNSFSSPKVIAVSLNSAIDRVLDVEGFEIGRHHRATYSTQFPAGKGVNVARAASILGQDTLLIGCIGAADTELFHGVESPLVTTNYMCLEGATRVNITIRDVTTRTVTHVTTDGFTLTTRDVDHITKSILDAVAPQDVMCLSGSLPGGTETSLYSDLIRQLNSAGVRVILDTSGDPLRRGVEAVPFMVKPNLGELEFLSGRILTGDMVGILHEAHILTATGVEWVIVSMGAAGVIAVQKSSGRAVHAWIKLETVRNTYGSVGSGDSLVAGFAVGLVSNQSFTECVQLGVACGAANVLSSTPGEYSLNDVNRLIPMITVEEMT